MEYHSIIANDGCPLSFQSTRPIDPDDRPRAGKYEPLILLIHGFSGSSEYFARNFAALDNAAWTVAVDLRGHGRSGRPKGGYHVARLAADLNELILFLKTKTAPGTELKIVPVGCSIGAAILWTYVELFADSAFAGMIFVDQAPLQDRNQFDNWDASKAHRGCYDEATMEAAQKFWIEQPEAAYKALVNDCLGYRVDPQYKDGLQGETDEKFFISESRRCDPVWLAKLLADHTRYDHRETCESITVPVNVMAGRRTGCFPLEGMKETVRRVKTGRERRDQAVTNEFVRWTEFASGHWLFYEEPDRFNKEVVDFVRYCCETK